MTGTYFHSVADAFAALDSPDEPEPVRLAAAAEVAFAAETLAFALALTLEVRGNETLVRRADFATHSLNLAVLVSQFSAATLDAAVRVADNAANAARADAARPPAGSAAAAA